MQENAARAAQLSQEATTNWSAMDDAVTSGIGNRSDSKSPQNANTIGTQELALATAAKKRAMEIVEWFPGRDGGPEKQSEIKNNAKTSHDLASKSLQQ